MTDLVNGYTVAALAYAVLGGLLAAAHDPAGKQSLGRLQLAIWISAVWAVAGSTAAVLHSGLAVLATGLTDHGRYGAWFAALLGLIGLHESVPPRIYLTMRRVAVALIAASTVFYLALSFGVLPASLGRWGVVLFLTLPVLGLVLIEQLYRNGDADLRWRQKPLCLALALLFVFDIYGFSEAALFARFDPTTANVRGLLHALAAPLLFIASRRHAHSRQSLRVSPAAAFHTVALLLVGGYLLFVAALGYYVRESGGDWGRALQTGVVFIAGLTLAALLLSQATRAKLRVLIAKNFFTYRYDYRAEWLRFTEKLAAAKTPAEVGQVVIQALADLVESPSGSLWTRSLDDQSYVQSATWNMPRVASSEPIDSAFVRLLAQRNWIVDLDEWQHQLPPEIGVLPEAVVGTPNAWLVVPLLVADHLAGFVVLGRPRVELSVDWEVRDLLKTASRQAASYLAQMHATEALLESRKFDAFNRMSAFVVHDLKNIVTQLSLMMKNAKRLQDNPEFRQDMLATVENSLDKMRQLMLQLREGDAPSSGASPVDLVRVSQRLVDAAKARGREVELHSAGPLATRGHEQRVERVLGHVVQNALDATPPEGRVWVRLERQSGQACVEVGDTGRGMTPEFVRERLFRPFSSTKSDGMGIGSYESFHYLKDLGGSIDVDSQVGRGTVVRMRLPLIELQQRSDLAEVMAK